MSKRTHTREYKPGAHEAWRTKNYKPPESIKVKESRLMKGIWYEDFVGFEGDWAR